jgi:hypothetical protein
MPEWLISLVSVVVGAAIGIGGTKLVQFLKRPKLVIDFEEKAGKKPYVPDYNNESMTSAGYTHRIKCLRLIVHNKGHKPAIDCEAKLEVYVEEAGEDIHTITLHWSRRDPALYSEYGEGGVLVSTNQEKVYTPISLNIHDREPVDVFQLPYHISNLPDTNHKPH